MPEPIKVDCHVHLYQTADECSADKEDYNIFEYGEKQDVHMSELLGSAEELLGAMDETGIDHAVILNLFVADWERQKFRRRLPDGMGEHERQARIRDFNLRIPEMLKDFNMWGCEIARDKPKLVPFVSVDLAAMSGKECARHVQNMVERHGAMGVKLHGAAQGYSMGDRRLWPVYTLCQDLDIPILGHSGLDAGGKGFAEPLAFAEALRAFPKLRLAIAHLGGGAWQQALEIAERFPNAFFDCCEIIEWTNSEHGPSDRQLAQLIMDIGPERVMMGSDFPWYDLDHTLERVFELPILSEDDKNGIIGANAMRILGIS